MGARFSATVQTSLGAHSASCKVCTGSFLGVKQLRHGVDHPPPSSTKLKERVQLYLYSPSWPLWLVPGRTVPLLLYLQYICVWKTDVTRKLNDF